MKNLFTFLTLFVFIALPSVGFAANCNSNKVYTDALGVRWGCDCNRSGGYDQAAHKGQRVLSSTELGKTMECKSGQISGDRWKNPAEGGWCAGLDRQIVTANSMQVFADKTGGCWNAKCQAGQCFSVKMRADGTESEGTCISPKAGMPVDENGRCVEVECGGTTDTASAGGCTGIYGTDCVVFDGRCMPICAGGGQNITETDKKITLSLSMVGGGDIGYTVNDRTKYLCQQKCEEAYYPEDSKEELRAYCRAKC